MSQPLYERDVIEAVTSLHRAKEEFNRALSAVNAHKGLEVFLEVIETKVDGGAMSTVTGIEVSVKKEIYL